MTTVLVAATTGAPGDVDPGATAWVLVATVLVMFMTPGVAFFYSGMVRSQHVLGMLMQSLAGMAVVSLVWFAVGFTLAFGGGNGVLGDLRFAGLRGLADADSTIPGFEGGTALVVPPLLFAAFQMMFAVITPVLVTGATAERWRFRSYVVFVAVWSLLVYAPVAHWVFSPDGWAARSGVLDFAGGLVVHVNAGAAGLAMAIVLGRRHGWPAEPMRPHNLPFVLLGASILWFGWFGFNGGSGLRADGVAVTALVNTHLAACAALVGWAGVERMRFGRSTTLGAASGAVAGLVAVTPAAGYVSAPSAVVIGVLAGVVSAFAVTLKLWFRFDDSLDVVGVHLVGGVLGSLAVGLFASTAVNPRGDDGVFHGGGYGLLTVQAVAVLAVAAYSFVVTLVIGRVLDRLVGNRVPAGHERAGLDLVLHGESAYELRSTTPAAPAAGPRGESGHVQP